MRAERSSDGIAVESLQAGTVLTVCTAHSRYRITIVDGAAGLALIRGGSKFSEDTPARIAGSTAGGSVLKQGWIGVGFRLEISFDHHRILTSSVRSVEVTDSAGPESAEQLGPPQPLPVAALRGSDEYRS
jgi:hypothetical protein